MKKTIKRPRTYECGKQCALYILQRGDKTEYEIREKLRKYEYPQDIIEKIIKFLYEYEFINDYDYACRYIKYRKKTRSILQIKTELSKKGVDRELVREILDNEDISQLDTIDCLVKKKKINWEDATREEINKVYASLVRKGFKTDEVLEIINKYKKTCTN